LLCLRNLPKQIFETHPRDRLAYAGFIEIHNQNRGSLPVQSLPGGDSESKRVSDFLPMPTNARFLSTGAACKPGPMGPRRSLRIIPADSRRWEDGLVRIFSVIPVSVVASTLPYKPDGCLGRQEDCRIGRFRGGWVPAMLPCSCLSSRVMAACRNRKRIPERRTAKKRATPKASDPSGLNAKQRTNCTFIRAVLFFIDVPAG